MIRSARFSEGRRERQARDAALPRLPLLSEEAILKLDPVGSRRRERVTRRNPLSHRNDGRPSGRGGADVAGAAASDRATFVADVIKDIPREQYNCVTVVFGRKGESRVNLIPRRRARVGAIEDAAVLCITPCIVHRAGQCITRQSPGVVDVDGDLILRRVRKLLTLQVLAKLKAPPVSAVKTSAAQLSATAGVSSLAWQSASDPMGVDRGSSAAGSAGSTGPRARVMWESR